MKNSIYAAGTLTLLGLAVPAAAGGVALCIETGKNSASNGTDIQYFLVSSRSKNGYDLRLDARDDFNSGRRGGNNSPVPACQNSDRSMERGEFVVIRGGRTQDYAGATYTTWALGYGSDRSSAIAEALRELRRRDWSWQDRHGYTVVEAGSF